MHGVALLYARRIQPTNTSDTSSLGVQSDKQGVFRAGIREIEFAEDVRTVTEEYEISVS